ncbi:MAG TPA: sensor domain-containing diguanylate cyclase, partial [Actinomycetota bacterium]|nr:sensor domain-containing diguanylate cyclase [Actinomycetota bacterium]
MTQARSIRLGRRPTPKLGFVQGHGGTEGGHADRLLAEITDLLVSEGSPDRVLEAVADALRQIVPHDTLTIYEADVPLRVLRPVLVRDTWADEILSMGPMVYGEGITGAAAEAQEPQLVNDVLNDPRRRQIAGTPEEEEALVVIPLVAHDALKGVLCLYRLGPGNVFTEDEFRLAIRFGTMASLAIDNAQIRARLETEVVTDHLTALYNHRYFHERLAEELREAVRKKRVVSVLLYDIDDFSKVNASHGHMVGDQVLQGVSSAGREVCRQGDVVCRIGGEEFAVILPGCSADDAAGLAERLRSVVASVVAADGDTVTVSVGIAQGPTHASAPRDLLACANAALRQAKADGKDCVRVFWMEQPGL